jgi:hypothetical protein
MNHALNGQLPERQYFWITLCLLDQLRVASYIQQLGCQREAKQNWASTILFS